MSRGWLATLSVLAIVASGSLVVWRYKHRPKPPREKLNILVISTCSLRFDSASKDMPRVNEFFKQGSFDFSNAYNGLGWTAIFAVTAPEIRSRWFRQVGYRPAGILIKNQMFLIPLRNSWKEGFTREDKMKGVTPPDSNFEKNYRESFDYFLDTITAPNPDPYFVVAQIKYPHYPLIDRFNSDSGWDQFLDADEKKRIEEYLKNPKKYPTKLPFLLMLTNDSKNLHAHPAVGAAIAREGRDGGHEAAFLGLLNTPQFLGDWKASKDFEIDLAILKKIYRANVLYMDKMIGEMLDRLKANGSLDKTLVVFVGDHGEVHMERGHLTHGTSWLDPSLHIPLRVRFPGQNESGKVDAQTNFYSLTKMITKVAEGQVDAKNFVAEFKKIADPVVIGRDCSNTWRMIRFDNKWKYAVDNSSGESWLYDLEKDPGETENIVATHPEVVAQMESLYWQKLPRLSTQMVNSCAPWPGPKAVRDEN